MKTRTIHSLAALLFFLFAMQLTSCTQEETITYSKAGTWKASNYNLITGGNDGNATANFTLSEAGLLDITIQDSTGTTIYDYSAETAENIDNERDLLRVFLMPPMVSQADTIFTKVRYELNQNELTLTVYEANEIIDSARASTIIDNGPTLYVRQ